MLIDWLKTLPTLKLKRNHTRKNKELDDINFTLLKKVSEGMQDDEGRLNDTTWNDLEMNQVFSKVNKTYTIAGEEVLYHWLKNPTLNEDAFGKRKRKLDYAKEYQASVATGLGKIGQFDHDYRAEIRRIDSKQTLDKKPIVFIISLVIMIALIWLTKSTFVILGACASILAIILYHYFHMARHKYTLSSFDYLVRMMIFFRKHKELIKNIYSDEYDLEALEVVADKLVEFKNTFNRLEGLDPIKDIAVALTLSNYWNYIKMSNLMCSYKDDVLKVADIVGEIDCAHGINAYLLGPVKSSIPNLSDGIHTLSIEDSYNLLIHDCVTNNVNIDKSFVITGSNMGGKSSYLRQVGVSIVLGQALCFSTSKTHKGGFFRVLSSISLNDDIESGKSYFMKEAEAIHRMLEIDNKHNTLFLIDEIFKGTNPSERLAASIEILNKLSSNHNVIVTTHDIGILSHLEDYEYFHFEHNITKTQMTFDYKLKKGVTEVKNAIKLMEYIEYPEDLIDSINQRIIKMNTVV